MLEERDGWFVVNVKDARWAANSAFGKICRLGETGRAVPAGRHQHLRPRAGKPNCRYHREDAQEDLLVLSGRCRLIVNDEARMLETWDFVHFPAGVTHVCVGVDDGPCAILFIGYRANPETLFYPASELARRYGAEIASANAPTRASRTPT